MLEGPKSYVSEIPLDVTPSAKPINILDLVAMHSDDGERVVDRVVRSVSPKVYSYLTNHHSK